MRSVMLQHNARMEMAEFDTLPKCVREVIANSPIGISALMVTRNPHNQYAMQTNPERFAVALDKRLRYLSKQRMAQDFAEMRIDI